MDRLKLVAIKPVPQYPEKEDYESRESAVDAVAAFGVDSIPTLIEISELADEGRTKKRALEQIARLKSGKETRY
jgi:hypothetical protein